jgi:tRNA nucleotidyltransferase (CCA-adding enzyme)
MALLEGCDALRKPDRFNDFLLVCEAIFRHSTLVDNDKTFTQGLLAMKGLELARGVDAKVMAKRGLEGPALGTALRQARIEALWPLFD